MEKWFQPSSGNVRLGLRKNKTISASLVAFALLLTFMDSSLLFADRVYKWQDEQGHWHFTNDADKQPFNSVKQGSSDAIHVTQIQRQQRDPIDLDEHLQEKLQPKSLIETAMLSVVSIQTATGRGAGFFVSNDGYIVTLAEVVRPHQSPEASLLALDALETELENANEAWEYEKTLRDDINNRVVALTNRRDELVGREKRELTDELTQQQRILIARNNALRQVERQFREKKAEFEQAKMTLNSDLNRAKIDQTFPIFFADGFRQRADLITVDSKSGLALLRLYGYLTPHLNIDHEEPLTFGMSLYALFPQQVDRLMGFEPTPAVREASVVPYTVTQKAEGEIHLNQRIKFANGGAPLVNTNGQLMMIALQPPYTLNRNEEESRGDRNDSSYLQTTDPDTDGIDARIIQEVFDDLF